MLQSKDITKGLCLASRPPLILLNSFPAPALPSYSPAQAQNRLSIPPKPLRRLSTGSVHTVHCTQAHGTIFTYSDMFLITAGSARLSPGFHSTPAHHPRISVKTNGRTGVRGFGEWDNLMQMKLAVICFEM